MINQCVYLFICVVVFYYAKKALWHKVESRGKDEDVVEKAAFWLILFISIFWIFVIPILILWNTVKFVDIKISNQLKNKK